MDLLLDTSFLIGRWRHGATGPEQRFITAHAGAECGLPWIVKAEFLRGAVHAGHAAARVRGFLEHFPVLWPDEDTLTVYATVWSRMAQARLTIGPHDLWIAACALRHGLPLVSDNTAEFARVPGLRVLNARDV